VKILAIEREVAPEHEQAPSPLLTEEARRVWELQTSGVIREIYFRRDRSAAVLMLECAGVDEATTILATLPLVRAGLIQFEIIPLSAYTGFSRLFAGERYPSDD